MNNYPINYQNQSMIDYFNLQPSSVRGRSNTATEQYKRLLWTKLYSVFEFDLPKEWKLNFFRYWLFNLGSISVIYTTEFGWVCQPYSILEIDLYYNPKKIQVYNSFVKDAKVGIVGLNCGIINAMDDYYGLDDIITKYAEQLAQVDRSINVNLMNCNVTTLFEADGKKQAEEVREAYQKATSGEPFVTINKDVLNGKNLTSLLSNVKNNYIVTDLLNARRSIMESFLTEIGIKNANTTKRERLNSDEVNSNNDETKAIVSVIYDNIKKAMQEINAISDLSLDVRLRYDYDELKEV